MRLANRSAKSAIVVPKVVRHDRCAIMMVTLFARILDFNDDSATSEQGSPGRIYGLCSARCEDNPHSACYCDVSPTVLAIVVART